MKHIHLISRAERRGILILSFAVFAFFASFFIIAGIENYNDSVVEKQRELRRRAEGDPQISFGITGFRPVPAGLHLITFFIFLSLLKPKRLVVPVILLLFYSGLILFALYSQVNKEVSFSELFHKRWVFEYVGVIFVLIMLSWLSSIHFRFHRQPPSDIYP